MKALYIYEHGTKLSIKTGKIVINNKQEIKVPIETVRSIFIFGRINVTTPFLMEVAKRDLRIIWLSKYGKYFGMFSSTSHVNIIKQRKQFKLFENIVFRNKLSKKFIKGKINNQYIFLKRLYRKYNERIIKKNLLKIKQISTKMKKANDIEEFMGYEGYVARLYFESISSILYEQYKFKRRSKRPPKDRFNSIISFGYTLLLYEIYSVIEINGLNPYAGFLHSDQLNHPALASDLIEEWRAVLIDPIAVRLIMSNSFSDSNFTNKDGGVFLNKEGVKIFISAYEKKMKNKHRYIVEIEEKLSFRQAVYHQIQNLVKVLLNENPDMYKSIQIR